MRQPDFLMERWQSHHENEVRCNLSDSGVLPFTLAEFCAVAGADPEAVAFGYGSTDGTPGLREAIAALYPGAGAGEVLACTGSAEANFLAMWRLVEAGDRVVIVTPTYGQTPGLATGLGADVVALPLDEALGWQPPPGAASEAITAGTRVVVVTNPNNPTGAVLSAESRAEIVAAAEAAGAWILADEVYAGAELEGEVTPTLWGSTDRVIATASLSKAYGLPGLRLGWLVAPPAMREELWARKDYTTIAPATLSDYLAGKALVPETRARIFARCRQMIRENLAIVEEWAGSVPGLAYRLPDAGAICTFRYETHLPSSDLAERLRVEDSVLIVPGAHFGLERSFRIGFGYDRGQLPAGLAAISAALGAAEGVTA